MSHSRKIVTMAKGTHGVRKTLILFFTFALVVQNVNAGSEGRTGMLFGNDHAFFFTAPDGWVLDNQSGVKQGLHMVFYPAGETWIKSPVIAYGKSVQKGGEINSPEDQVKRTLRDFHAHGSPNYSAERKSFFSLPNNKEAAIYYFKGDKWGNFEAVGYIEESVSINFLVFNARSKGDFDNYLPSFFKLLGSYRNSFDGAETVSAQVFEELVKEARQQSSTPKGKAYEASVTESLGQLMADSMRGCTEYVASDEITNFQMVLRIGPDGVITEAYASPENRLTSCFRGLIANTRCPRHEFDTFLLFINMKISDLQQSAANHRNQ
jgi:hypothetical protein